MYNHHSINNEMKESIVPLKHLSWNSIFAGVILSIIIEILFLILGSAVGAIKTLNIFFEKNYNHLGTGITFWIIISMLVAISVGAYISGRLANSDGLFHGIIVWSLNTLIYSGLLFFIFFSVISNTMNFISTGLQTISNSSSSIIYHVTQQLTDGNMPNNNILDSLKEELEQLLPWKSVVTGSHDPSIINWLQKILQSNQSSLRDSDIDFLRDLIQSHSTKYSDAQVEQLVQQIQKIYQKYHEIKSQTFQTLMEVAQITLKKIARISWFTLFFLILEGLLAAIMGLIGHRHRKNYI
ncbi:MAG: YrzE family protein [Candidatus Dasytiphilus stammeri]